MSDVSARGFTPRGVFLRRAGAFGIAGATMLGFPIAEARPARGDGPAVVRIGHIESFSGYNAAGAYSQSSGMQLAIEEANKRNSRVRFELVAGDDMNDPAIGLAEARRLVVNERVDVLAGLSSTAVAMEVMRYAEEAGVFLLQIGTSGTSITGSKASRVSFRTTCNNQMLTNALAPALLAQAGNWFFLTVDYEFGIDAEARLTRLLLEGGGRVAGSLRHRNGETEFARYVDIIARSDADAVVLCNGGSDVQNAVGAIARAGLHRRMQIGGVMLDNYNVIGLPVQELVGSLWGYVWGPDAGGDRTAEIYGKLKARARGFPSNWSQYIGYIAGEQLTSRLWEAGTTDTSALIQAFEDERGFDAGKRHPSRWRRCDHQLAQDTYAAQIVSARKRRNAYEFFKIVHTVAADQAADSCSSRDAVAATHRFAEHGEFPHREAVVF